MNVHVENATRKSAINLEYKHAFLKEFYLYFSDENLEIHFLMYFTSSRMYNLEIGNNGAQCCDHLTFENDT